MNKLFPLYVALCLWISRADAQQWGLATCVDYALQHSQQMQASEREASASHLAAKAAKAQIFPTLAGTASMDHYWKIPVQVFPGELLGQPEGSFVPVRLGTPWMGNYGLEASVDVANPATWQQVKLAVIRARAAGAEREGVSRMLKRHVHMAYHAAALGRQRLELAQARMERVHDIHRLITKRFKQGLSDRIEWNQSRTLVNDVEAAQNAAHSDYQTSLIDLKFWMGYPLDSTLQVPAFQGIPGLQTAADSHSPADFPEYAKYRSGADLALQRWKASRVALLPSLSVSAGYNRLGFGSSMGTTLRDDWFPSGYVGLRLRIPILSVSDMVYTPRQHRLLAQAAALSFAEYQAREQKNLMQEQHALEKAVAALRIQEANMLLARENEQLVFQKLEKGIVNLIELKEIQQTLDQATALFIDAQLDYLRHHVELHYLQNKL
ncbi:TolC family protein [Parapedobacter deserti]|uniref:TolC family protein n=1 Tax=Parapedobacter deserti TaxID=1912957 RepID=A0ABV7JIQ9_9SPHI